MDKKCPFCAESIKLEAIKCRYCQSELPGHAVSGTSSAALAQPVAYTNKYPTEDIALQYDAQKKVAGIAYFLWFFLGSIGAHRFYFSKVLSGMALALFAFGSGLALVLVSEGSGGLSRLGLAGASLVGLWVLIDAFLIPSWSRDFNSALVNQLKENPQNKTAAMKTNVASSRSPAQAISICICPKCRAQGNGTDVECGRCGHVFA